MLRRWEKSALISLSHFSISVNAEVDFRLPPTSNAFISYDLNDQALWPPITDTLR